jgi:hypothetical protein
MSRTCSQSGAVSAGKILRELDVGLRCLVHRERVVGRLAEVIAAEDIGLGVEMTLKNVTFAARARRPEHLLRKNRRELGMG